MIELVRFVSLTALGGVMLAPGLVAGPSLDAAVFTQVASEVAAGATLYVDVWDHKPPGIYLLVAGLRVILPFLDPWHLNWLVSILATGGIGYTLLVVARRAGASTTAAIIGSVGAVLGMSQYLLALGGGLTEPIATLPVTVSLALLMTRRGSEPVRTVLVGFLMSLGLLVSLQVMPGVLAVAGLLLWVAGPHSRLRALLLMMAGGLLAPAAFASWLAASGALDGALDALVSYSVAYRLLADPGPAGLAGPVMSWTLLSLLFLIVPAALGSLALRRTSTGRAVGVMCLAWIALTVALLLYQGRLYAHYAIPLVVPLGVLAAIGVDRVLLLVSGASRAPMRLAYVVPMAATCAVSVVGAVLSGQMSFVAVMRDHPRSVAVATAIRNVTAADDRVWVWGNEPQVYLYAGRRQATRYAYLLPLVTPGYTTSQQVASVVADLAADPPGAIVDVGSPGPGQPGFAPLLLSRPVASDGRDYDILDPIRQFVRERYELATIAEGWVVYRLKSGSLGETTR